MITNALLSIRISIHCRKILSNVRKCRKPIDETSLKKEGIVLIHQMAQVETCIDQINDFHILLTSRGEDLALGVLDGLHDLVSRINPTPQRGDDDGKFVRRMHEKMWKCNYYLTNALKLDKDGQAEFEKKINKLCLEIGIKRNGALRPPR